MEQIAAAFDSRAANYARNEWHRLAAERLVALGGIRPGDRVLDACTGTGFAALAAARAAGPNGRVVGVDISAGMLEQARLAQAAAAIANVEFVQADASDPALYPDQTFDVVTCAAGLLYLPVAAALQAWHRLLKPGGTVAFSTMRAGFPVAGRIFRDCAAEFGVSLTDPSAELGSIEACRDRLQHAGFDGVSIIGETIAFSAQDLSMAWESNVRSARHAAVRNLSPADQERLRLRFADALARADAGALGRGGILYAIGRR